MLPLLTNTPKFSAEDYRAGRPLYPSRLFRTLRTAVAGTQPVFLDLGCGTGQSTRSYLDFGISRRGFAVDPDAAMLAIAREALADPFPEVVTRNGSAEAIPLDAAAVDLVLIGSALHWFNLPRAYAEISRVLKPGGHLFVFEYQFPKCLESPAFAEKIRRRFNLEWKAPRQAPRGSLADLLAPFRNSGDWEGVAVDRPEWTESLDLPAFLGHLFSQSRYLHAEADAVEPGDYRRQVAESLAFDFGRLPLLFDLKPRTFLFQKNSGIRQVVDATC